jgi:NAD(P)-dependent dehydrogenase (short-subunit alcohol dehydrogenase family)
MPISDYLPADLFKNQTVFVTGGTSGINLGIARCFARLGANLGICGRDAEKAKRAAEELRAMGAQVHAESADVREYEALERALENTRKRFGAIGTLVAGAAGNFPCPAEQMSANGFKVVIDIDLVGAFNAARAAFEQLKETRGSVVFISAGQSFQPYAMQAHVGAAKAGIDQLMRNLALEWGHYGIRCNSIAPGPIEGTEGVRRLIPQGAREGLTRAIPLQRFGTPEDIGQVAVFLASPLASYVTGTLLVADGGQNLLGSGVWTQMVMKHANTGER